MRKIEITNRGNPEGADDIVLMVANGEPFTLAPGRSHIIDLDDYTEIYAGHTPPSHRIVTLIADGDLADAIASLDAFLEDNPGEEPEDIQAQLAAAIQRRDELDAQLSSAPDDADTAAAAEADERAAMRETLINLPMAELRAMGAEVGVKGTSKAELADEILAIKGGDA